MESVALPVRHKPVQAIVYGVSNRSFQVGFREEWHDTEYRHAYMEAAVEQGIAWQIKFNRESRKISQKKMAELLGTQQSAVSRLEDPEYGAHSLETLKKVANIFDCALLVRLVPYSILARELECLSKDELIAEAFSEELKKLGNQEKPIRKVCYEAK